MPRSFAEQADQRVGVDEEGTRHAVDRDQHDRKDDAATATSGERSDRDGVDQIGHAEQVPRDGGGAGIRFAGKPPVRDQGCKNARQDVAHSGWDREQPRQLPLEIADQEHSTENPDRLYGNQPVLWDDGNDLAEGLREEQQVSGPKGHHQRNRYPSRPHVEAEEAVSGKQHDADKPSGADDRGADRPAPPTPLVAGQRADSDVEPEQRQGRQNEQHRTFLFTTATTLWYSRVPTQLCITVLHGTNAR